MTIVIFVQTVHYLIPRYAQVLAGNEQQWVQNAPDATYVVPAQGDLARRIARGLERRGLPVTLVPAVLRDSPGGYQAHVRKVLQDADQLYLLELDPDETGGFVPWANVAREMAVPVKLVRLWRPSQKAKAPGEPTPRA